MTDTISSTPWAPTIYSEPVPSATNIYQALDAYGLKALTPQLIANAYSIPYSTGANTKIGIIGFAGAGWSGDLANSMSNMGLTTPSITYVPVDGQPIVYGANSAVVSDFQSWTNELNLDVYCVAGTVPAANIVVYLANVVYGGFSANGYTSNWPTSWGNAVQRAVDENCDVISMSICARESDYNSFWRTKVEPAISNAVAKGITVLAATGDSGSDDYSTTNVRDLGVTYPSTSPNVVAVGGTHLTLTSGNTRLTETLEFNDPIFGGNTGGGAGISSIFTRPSYQANLYYTPYFRANTYTGTRTLLANRGVPDISAPMNGYGLWYANTIHCYGGTSASTPLMAGIIARFISLNGGRRPPVSNVYTSVNQIFYSNINIFNKTTGNAILTTGNNDVANVGGYLSTTGWDPVTGLGVPLGSTTYQAFTSAGTQVKTAANTWSYLANVKIKTGATTWSNVRAIWTKTVNGWAQSF